MDQADERRAERIAERVREALDRVGSAAAKSGRAADAVTVVAAAKTRNPAEVDAALAAGITDIGENYVQEAETKRAEVHRPATWRLIGHLQRNKAGSAVEVFDTVDSVDSARLARALGRRAEPLDKPLNVLLQVRLGGESSKSGCDPAEAEAVLKAVQQTPSLRCLGVMTIPPPPVATEATEAAAEMRPFFAELRELAETLRGLSGLPLTVLSMGMSQDYEVAIEEGATHVRLGTAIFGPRG